MIQIAGLHCSLGGKLPKANKGILDVTAFQLALKRSHSKVMKQAKLIINMRIKLIKVLEELENNVFLSF
tara:strand:+ start:167 stop:373 length:207 start_codon:yes stop_codon:yes gene_type:complete